MNADTQPVNIPFPGTQTRLLDYHNWIHLNTGDRVLVKLTGCAPAHGTMDDIGDDASYLLGLDYFWVRIVGQSRILIFHSDGTIIHKILA